MPAGSDPGEEGRILPDTKKSKGVSGAALAAGTVAGVGAVSFEAIGAGAQSEKSAKVELLTEEETVDSTSTAGKKNPNFEHLVLPEAALSEIEHIPEPVLISSNPNVMLVPDHLNVGNAPDNMSFKQAFDWSRGSMGSGALFEWQGELYHTCHPDEFAALPDKTKALFTELWVKNEEHPLEMMAEGKVASIELPLVAEDHDESNSPHEDPENQHHNSAETTQVDANVEAENTLTDDPGPTYSPDEFDSDFQGSDEWINPNDSI